MYEDAEAPLNDCPIARFVRHQIHSCSDSLFTGGPEAAQGLVTQLDGNYDQNTVPTRAALTDRALRMIHMYPLLTVSNLSAEQLFTLYVEISRIMSHQEHNNLQLALMTRAMIYGMYFGKAVAKDRAAIAETA